MKYLVGLILTGAFELCTAGRILYLVPIPSKSHYILSEPLVDELAERDHEVIVVAPFRKQRPVQNVEEIVIPDVRESFFDEDPLGNTSERSSQMRHKFTSLYSTSGGREVLMDKIMTHQPVIDLLNSDRKIDLVVGISSSAEGLLAGFAHRFKAPMVAISTSVPHIELSEMVGNPSPSSYVPDFGLCYTDEMNFLQRLVNFLHATFSEVAFYAFYLPRQNNLMRKYFGEDVPPLKELLLNNSLLLVNHHFSMGFPRPYLPNVVEIGGYHVRPAKPLPKDLENTVEEAKDGVIYFSLGSNLKPTDFATEKIDGIISAFSNLTQTVLWKFESENMTDLPENVIISKWLPQTDILAHPNLKLFITHGGLLTLTESIYRGVPVVGIPVYPDQSANVKHVENLKVGVKLEFDAISEATMFSAIQEVLTNPTYSINAKARSEILQDRPLSPTDTAVYWLEYVMKYKGAPHLRSGARHLAWYQLHMFDVFLFLLVLLVTGIFIMHKFFCWIFKILREVGVTEKFFLKKTD